MMGPMDEAVRNYIDAIRPAEHRRLFDRVEQLTRGAYPDVELGLSYGMPTFRTGDRRLYVGAWKHGLSLYGWDEGRDGSFTARHPELSSGRGTIRLPPAVAEGLDDDELLVLVRAALDASGEDA